MTTPRPHDDALRLDLIHATALLIASGGPTAVSLREVASACNTSTTAIYSLFGGKSQLIYAVAAEGFADLAITLASVPSAELPGADGDRERAAHALTVLAATYRQWALAHPALFTAMFSLTSTSSAPMPWGPSARNQRALELEDLVESSLRSALQPMREAAAVAARPGADPESVLNAVWVPVHGWVVLELQGRLAAGECETYTSGIIRGALA
ncbi:MAG: TetR/AcrR family transcriptional regulator [Dermabacter sp.]|nr:TetR/AcrR family transcriptional regulator [Dermabacter sp.]